IVTALLQLVSGEHGRLRAGDLLLGNELVEVRRDVEDARRRRIRPGNGHAAFRSDQADVADRRLSVVSGEVPKIRADTAAGPVADQAVLAPVVLGIERAGAVGDVFEEAGALGMFLAGTAGHD